MKAVSNASPLITLARIGLLDLLPELFEAVVIPGEVYDEVVIAGSGMPGAFAISNADWISVSKVRDTKALGNWISRFGLGAGETSAVFLAKELGVELVLMDERRGRRLAKANGLAVSGCVGILEELYRRGKLAELRKAYQQLLLQNIRIDLRTLQSSLRHFDLPPLTEGD